MRLVYIALGWTIGMILAANSPVQLPLIWLVLALLALFAVLLLSPQRRLAGITLVALTLGGLRFSLSPNSSALAAYNNTGGSTIEGIVIEMPNVRDNAVLLRVEAETVTKAGSTVPIDGLALVRAPSTVDVQYGDRIRATGLLISPAEFDAFSYADYLARSGVYSIMSRASVEVLSSGHGSPIQQGLFGLRGQAGTNINAALPESAAGLLNGILLGDERSITPQVRDAFAITGTAHLLAISGFNMVVLGSVIQRLLRHSRRSLAATTAIAFMLLYAMLVGATPAVMRAALMSSLLILGEALRRNTFVPSSLAFALLVLSLGSPTILWDIGFQLSFFATLGLALFATPLTTWLNHLLLRFMPRAASGLVMSTLSDTVAVSMAALITTLPLTILYFGQLSLVGLIANVLVVPLQAPLLILGAIATVTASFAPALAQALYWLDLVLLSWTAAIVRLFARLPGAQIEFGIDPRLVFLFFTALIGWAMAQALQPEWLTRLAGFLQSRLVQSATVFAGLCTLVLTSAVVLSRPDGKLHVWMLDLGGYNAVLAQTPGGAQMLVDGGSFPSQLLTALGERMPFNDREIEVIAVTQPDEANFSALAAVLERYRAEVVLSNGQPNMGEAWEEFQQATANMEQVVVRAGYTVELDDGTTVEVLHPQAPPDLEDHLNDGALVLRLSYGEVSFLLTSDVSTAGQQTMIETGENPVASVLQLPQNGLAVDEVFLRATQPQVALLQINSANSRQAADVLALLGDTPVYRTDESGTLHLWTDGRQLWLLPERS